MAVIDLVQLNPEILTDDATYVARLVELAREFVRGYCNLPRFPELSQGYSKTSATATTDISGLSSNVLWLSVNGSARVSLSLDLAACTTLANTAAELQTKIRAVANSYYGFDEVTVTSGSGAITITSGRYGEGSVINVLFEELTKQVAQALKFSPTFGGTEYPGMAEDAGLVQATASLVEQMYRRMGVEGMQSFGMHQGEFNAAIAGIADPLTLAQLQQRRRIW